MRSSKRARRVALSAAALLALAPTWSAGAPSLAGVHWYSGDGGMLDLSVPAGERGFNVEVIFDTGWCDGDPGTDPGDVRSVAATARAHGLVNIIRVDYRQMQAVPTTSAEYASWAAGFVECTQELGDLASLFVVGNEPNIEDGGRPEGDIRADEYASAFNYLYSRKGEMPSGTQLLATFNSPFTPPGWMLDMSSRLGGVDGFALHTGGVRPACRDPRQGCSYGGWSFDGAFRYYRDVVARIHSSWSSRPVYITEFNTYTGDVGSEPDANYPADWINQAFEEVRSYNATRGSRPEVKALCWFVDRPQSWPRFSLRNVGAARADMGEEFRNPANRGAGGGTPPVNVARSAVGWAASSVYGAAYGGDKAKDGVVSAASKWTSDGATADSWLALDLGRSYDVTQLVVRHAGSAGESKGYNTQAFRLESGPSLSGPWTTQAAVSNSAQDDVSTVTLAGPVATRCVRLFVTDAGVDNYARIPELEVYGVPGSVPPTPTTLVNGDFESGPPGGPVGTGWTTFSSAGYGSSFVVATDAVHGGSLAQRVTSPQPSSPDRFGGVHQVVATTPGRQYTVRAWSRTHLTGGVAWDHIARLGIDPAGGTSFEAPSIEWAEFDSAKDAWHPREVVVTASGPSMTIYLESWRKWASGGDSLTWFDDVQVVSGTPPPVNHPPTAVAAANPGTGPAPLTVAFSGTGSSDPDGDALTYAWSFGDGAQGTGATVSHTYSAAGSYTATLTVSDGRGGTGSASTAVTATPPANRPPTAVASASPTSGPAPLTVAFSGAGSSDPDGDVLTFSWSFGDGAAGTGAVVSHTYSAAGSFTATLTVGDGRGGTSTATVAVRALAAAGPLANGDFESSVPGSALATGWIAFSSSGYAPTFAVVSDEVHGGSLAQRVTAPRPSSNDMFAGVYQVVATSPGVRYTVRAWSRTHFAGGIAWDHIARLGIDLGGGNDFQAGRVEWLEFDSAKDAWHPLETVVVASGASMTIYLESWRKWASGGDAFAWFDDVQVVPGTPPPTNRPPTAVATASPTSGSAPLTVAFSGSGSSDPDGDPLMYAWSFGDGAAGSGVSESHTYPAAGSYTATLTVDDGRGGTHGAEVLIVVDPPSGNRPPTAVISASPKSSTMPFTATLDGRGSSDPDGDALSYSWRFLDGVQGSGPTMQRSFQDANGDMQEAGGYLVTLTVSDGKGGTGSASVRIGAFPPGCPPSLDFDAIRAQLSAQGQDLEFVKVGFHTGGGGTFRGLGLWERCLDAAGVPFTLKQVPSFNNGSVGEVVGLRGRSGVPHTAIYRRCCDEYELPACAANGDWSNCTDAIAEQEARAHWLRHLQAFPREVLDNKQSVWVETINEPWKGDSTRNNAEWLARFSYYSALEALAAGYNYAAFGWSSGEPEDGPPPDSTSPGYQWDGPEMQRFLRLAAQHPGRVAVSLHEYNYGDPTLRATYPSLVGRFQRLLERCDAHGIGRPTVLITEFGWPGTPSAGEVMAPDNVPWAAGLYARFRTVKGVALWDQGDMGPVIARMAAYALQTYFAIPKLSRPASRLSGCAASP